MSVTCTSNPVRRWICWSLRRFSHKIENEVHADPQRISRQQWCGQPKIRGMSFDFKQATVFCLGHRLSKYKVTWYARNLVGHDPLGPTLATPMVARLLLTRVGWPKSLFESSNKNQAKNHMQFSSFVWFLRHTYLEHSNRFSLILVWKCKEFLWQAQVFKAIKSFILHYSFCEVADSMLGNYKNDTWAETTDPCRLRSQNCFNATSLNV